MIKDIKTNPDCKEFVSEAEALKEFGLDWNDNLVGFRQTLNPIRILQIIFAYAIMSVDKRK